MHETRPALKIVSGQHCAKKTNNKDRKQRGLIATHWTGTKKL